MKKFISLLLALVMVFSMGAIAFADEAETEAPETSVKHEIDLDAKLPIVGVSVNDVLNLAKQIFANVKLGQIEEALGTTIKTLGDMVEALKPLFKDVNVDDIPATMMNEFINALAKLLNTDRQGVLDALMEIPLVKEIMGWYGYKDPTTAAPETTTEAPETETEAPSEEVPNTGAAAGVAVFASLSVAAAAAFVSKKKAA